MQAIQLSPYLLVVALTATSCSFLPHVTAKSEDNFPKAQLSNVGLHEVRQYSVIPTPNVKFPKDIFPEIKFSELTNPQIHVQENSELTIITVPADLLFDSHTARLHLDAEKVLYQVSQAITNRYPGTWLQILGHTDSVGSAKSNLDLSEKQVATIQKWLSKKGGIDLYLMTRQGYGGTQPLVPNKKPDDSDNPSGRQQNRRIEIVVQKHTNPV